MEKRVVDIRVVTDDNGKVVRFNYLVRKRNAFFAIVFGNMAVVIIDDGVLFCQIVPYTKSRGFAKVVNIGLIRYPDEENARLCAVVLFAIDD